MSGRGLRIRRRALDVDPDRLPGSLHPVLRRVYAARGIDDADALDHAVARLQPPDSLSGIDRATELLSAALDEQRAITVVGDFDADGATGTAVLVRGLRLLGASRVGWLVPSRFRDGYGLGPGLVASIADDPPDLLITVDNGISSIDGVRAARDAGIQVVVTDHHLPGAVLPEADAIVNPRLVGDGFPSKALAGVGVAFYLVAALRARRRGAGGDPGPPLAGLLDLVALGTVADVVPLDHNNRVLVAQGLARIRAGRACPGIAALLEVSGRDPARAVASDLSFAVGPRLNAAGRIAEMDLGIACLLSDSTGQARELALRLDELNRQRRTIEGRMREQAAAHLEGLEIAGDLPAGVALFDPDWHQGVVGILAARVRERVHRPVVAFARNDDGLLRGSARSVPGVHVRDVLEQVASAHPGLIGRFGGHAMAAGLTLAEDGFARFAPAFAAAVAALGEGAEDAATVVTDGALAAADLGLELAEVLRAGGPWGQGFPEPLFDGEFELVERRVVKERHLRLGLAAPGGGAPLAAIAFGIADTERDPRGARRVRAVYRLDVNEYRGRRSAQLVIEHIEALPG